MRWRKAPELDATTVERPWIRDAHLERLDPYLLPVLKRRRWAVSELTVYCGEKRRLRFLRRPLIERWLETSEDRGLARTVPAPDREEEIWEVTERGYGRVFNLVPKLIGIAGTASAIFAVVFGMITESTKEAFQIPLGFGLALIVGWFIGAHLGDLSGRIRDEVLDRERQVQDYREHFDPVIGDDRRQADRPEG